MRPFSYGFAKPRLWLCAYSSEASAFKFSENISSKKQEAEGFSISDEDLVVGGRKFPKDELTNVTPQILRKLNRNLVDIPFHPLNILKSIIENYFKYPRPRVVRESFNRSGAAASESMQFKTFSNICPIVTVSENFDSLCFPADHTGRSTSDTYYLNRNYLLRTHTTAHEVDLLKNVVNDSCRKPNDFHGGFIHFGDNYRRDEIDSVHYPVFHQLEAVRLFSAEEIQALRNGAKLLSNNTVFSSPPINASLDCQPHHNLDVIKRIIENLQSELEGLFLVLFGPSISFEWIRGEFPFTFPSLECEIVYNNKKLEVCGCGILKADIVNAVLSTSSLGDDASESTGIAWAVGIGLERLAMIMFKIPDIRLFWTDDPRFLDQFKHYYPLTAQFLREPFKFITPFSLYSKFPPVHRDVSFWVLPMDQREVATSRISHATTKRPFHANALFEVIRDEAVDDIVESVVLTDSFVNPKDGRTSQCYRITFRSMDRNLTTEEVNAIQARIRSKLETFFPIILR